MEDMYLVYYIILYFVICYSFVTKLNNIQLAMLEIWAFCYNIFRSFIPLLEGLGVDRTILEWILKE